MNEDKEEKDKITESLGKLDNLLEKLEALKEIREKILESENDPIH